MYFFTLDDKTNLDVKVQVTKRPNFPSSKRKYKQYDIPGRDGSLYQDLGTYEDITVQIDMNYIGSADLWHSKWREIKKWLLKTGYRKISTSDDQDYYWLVKKIELSDNERRVIESGEFTVTLTCEGLCYLKDGLDEHTINEVLVNNYETSKPIYKIKGEGVCHLVVNGTDVKCNVGQSLIIDTYRELCYKEDKTPQNTSINQDYKDLYLISGNNTISITNGFTLSIIPNWRCL